MEPGDYTVCMVSPAAFEALELDVLPAQGCGQGNLVENGELRLMVDEIERP